MTRQKKELIRRMDEIEGFIEADIELGCGFYPEGAYSEMEEEHSRLYEELAHLRGYPDGMTMMMDPRGLTGYYADPEIPFR